MKKAIAMRCTKEQFESIKPKLESVGLEISQLKDFETSCYLVNNFSGNINSITNILPYDINSYNRKVYQEWNKKLFLEACGIEVEKPIRTNKLTELEKRVEVLEAKIKLDDLSDTIKIVEELKNYKHTWVGLDFSTAQLFYNLRKEKEAILAGNSVKL